MKRIVVPGELVTEQRKRIGSHVYAFNGKIYSDVVGVTENESSVASVVPLKGFYLPQENDIVVGLVVSELFAGFLVDINSFYLSFLSKERLREPLRRGSIVSARISKVNELNEAELSEPRVFYGGDIFSISPVKVPRVIGKNASMLDTLKRGTNCHIVVGRNGRVWAKGGNTELLFKAIKKIEMESHTSNLTNKIAEFLSKERNTVLNQKR
jgi:exosome complex component RRP4